MPTNLVSRKFARNAVGKLCAKRAKPPINARIKKCFIIQRRSLEHFVSRQAFDMVGLGPKILNKLIEEGLIKDAADLF